MIFLSEDKQYLVFSRSEYLWRDDDPEKSDPDMDWHDGDIPIPIEDLGFTDRRHIEIIVEEIRRRLGFPP